MQAQAASIINALAVRIPSHLACFKKFFFFQFTGARTFCVLKSVRVLK